MNKSKKTTKPKNTKFLKNIETDDEEFVLLKKYSKFMDDNNLIEFEFKHGDDRFVKLRKGDINQDLSSLSIKNPKATKTHADEQLVVNEQGLSEASSLFKVKSPFVGTFYLTPSPGKPPFVKVGDSVRVGQTLGIVEAMKLMNEIECEFSGVVKNVLVPTGTPVEYGETIFEIELS